MHESRIGVFALLIIDKRTNHYKSVGGLGACGRGVEAQGKHDLFKQAIT